MAAAAAVTAIFAIAGSSRPKAPNSPMIHRQVVRNGSGPVPVPASWVAQGVDPGTPLGGIPAPGFQLTDQFGRRASLAAWRGKVVVLAFVDSRSTTLSPLTAQTLIDASRLLGKGMREVQLVGVNANPTYTSVADVRAWSSRHAMLHRWRYLTAPGSALRAVWKQYGVSVQTVGTTVQQTPSVFVIDPHGREQAVFLTSGIAANLGKEADVLARTVNRYLPHPVALTPLKAQGAEGRAALPAPTHGAFVLAGLTDAGSATTVRVGDGLPHVVAFFATWCHACGKDLRILDRYERSRAATDPSVVAVDLTIAEPSTAYVRQFVVREHLAFPVALDATGSVADAYGVTALPSLAVVDAAGRIVWRHEGVLALPTLRAAVHDATARARG
jgi:cytochrome oxidase Cu insertion factor (SCO1/SenC/PrrC family)